MLARLREARLILPLLLSVPVLALLLGLGTWQWQRKAWKEDLLARIAERTTWEAADLARLQPDLASREVESLRRRGIVERGVNTEIRHTLPPGAAPVVRRMPQGHYEIALGRIPDRVGYYRVRADGRFLHDQEQLLYAPDPRRGPGYHVYTPLALDGGGVVIVNRGFVPERLADRKLRPEPQSSDVEVVGLLRWPAEKGNFDPDRDPRTGVFYWRDLAGMVRAAGLDGAGPIYGFFLDIERSHVTAEAWPRGGATRLDIPNRHLEYAMTWWGLAATFIVVLAAFASQRLRASRR